MKQAETGMDWRVVLVKSIIYLSTSYATDIIRNVKENETVILCCNLTHTNVWSGPPNLVPFTDKTKITSHLPRRDRLSILGTKRKQFNLKIKDFKKEDEGMYKCQQYDGLTTITDIIYNVTIQVDPNVVTDSGLTCTASEDIFIKYTEMDNKRVMECIPDGFPSNYTVLDWEHKTEYGETIRFLHDSGHGSIELQKYRTNSNWIFDRGLYVCTVASSLPVDGQTIIRKQYFLNETGSPHFISSNRKKQYGLFGSVATIIASFISLTVENKLIVIIRNDIQEEVKGYHYSIEDNVTVQEIVYGKNVTLRGSRIYIHIPITSPEEFSLYNIEVTSQYGSSSLEVYLKEFERKEKHSDIEVHVHAYRVILVALFGIIVLSVVVYLIVKRRQHNTITRSNPLTNTEIEQRNQYEEIDSTFYAPISNTPQQESDFEVRLNILTNTGALNRTVNDHSESQMSNNEIIDSFSIAQSDQSVGSSDTSYLNPSQPYTELKLLSNNTQSLHMYEKVTQWTPNAMCLSEMSSSFVRFKTHPGKRSTI